MSDKPLKGQKSLVERTPSPSVSTRRVTRNSPLKASSQPSSPIKKSLKKELCIPEEVEDAEYEDQDAHRPQETTPTKTLRLKTKTPSVRVPKVLLPKKIQDKETQPIKKESRKKQPSLNKVYDSEDDEDDDSNPNPQINFPDDGFSSDGLSEDNHVIDPPKELTKDAKLQKEGARVFALMTSKEVEEVLQRINEQCSAHDKVSAKKRERMVDWEEVSFLNYTSLQCEALWTFLNQHTRKVRILKEVVEEVKFKLSESKAFETKLIESLPNFPKKTTTYFGGFHYFNRELWEHLRSEQSKDLPNYVQFRCESKVKWEKLPQPEKAKYEGLAELARADYRQRVKDFYDKNPNISARIDSLEQEDMNRKRKQQADNRTARTRREETVVRNGEAEID